jgi:hypothetical protein
MFWVILALFANFESKRTKTVHLDIVQKFKKKFFFNSYHIYHSLFESF